MQFRTTRTIDRPAADVWQIVADYSRDPEWRSGVETMAPSGVGPAVVGTTTDEVLHVGGRTYRSRGEVVALEPGRRLQWRTTSGADADGARTVEPIDGGRCTVTLDLRVRAHGFEVLLVPVLRRVLAKGQRADLDGLAALAERTAVLGR